MGKLIFGTDESITCIQPVAVKGSNGEELCLAYKTSTLFIGAGVFVKDDGYVLGVSDNWYYPMPAGAELKELQSAGLMPDPIPEYALPLWRYGVGYSLWVLIAVIVALSWWTSARKKRRLREDAAAPVSVGPPVVETEQDRALAELVRPMLSGNEQIEQQAYGFPEPMMMNGDLVPGDKTALGVLTTQRLLLVHVKKAEVLGVDEVPRSRIAGVVSDDGLMHFQLDDGSLWLLWVRRKEKGYSNQLRFIRDLPKVFPIAAVAADPQPVAA